jgi:hypothetical protein
MMSSLLMADSEHSTADALGFRGIDSLPELAHSDFRLGFIKIGGAES